MNVSGTSNAAAAATRISMLSELNSSRGARKSAADTEAALASMFAQRSSDAFFSRMSALEQGNGLRITSSMQARTVVSQTAAQITQTTAMNLANPDADRVASLVKTG